MLSLLLQTSKWCKCTLCSKQDQEHLEMISDNLTKKKKKKKKIFKIFVPPLIYRIYSPKRRISLLLNDPKYLSQYFWVTLAIIWVYNLKDIGPSYKTDLELWVCFESKEIPSDKHRSDEIPYFSSTHANCCGPPWLILHERVGRTILKNRPNFAPHLIQDILWEKMRQHKKMLPKTSPATARLIAFPIQVVTG